MDYKKKFRLSFLFLIIFIGWRSLYTDARDSHDHHHAHMESEENHEHQDENIVKLTEDQILQFNIQTRLAEPGSLSLTISAPGKIILQPDHVAHIIPKVSGIARLANKNLGDVVKVGELMAILDSNEMADIKALYLSALSKQRLATSVLEREERLYQEKVSPLQDFMIAKNRYEEAVIDVQLAKQKLRAFGLTEQEILQLANQENPDLRLYQIRTPIQGTVIMRHVTQGEFIENNQIIYQVADLSTVWVEIGVYPKDLYRVKKGQIIEIVMPMVNKVFQAQLSYVSPIVSEETITTKAIAELNNSQGLWHPGTFVNVNIKIDHRYVPLMVSKEAIQNSEGEDFIFVETSEGFEKRIVKIGLSDQDHVQILSGLKPGENYVVNQTFLLKAELDKKTAEHSHSS